MGFPGVRGTRRFLAGWTIYGRSFLQGSVQTSPEEHTETDCDPERGQGTYQQGCREYHHLDQVRPPGSVPSSTRAAMSPRATLIDSLAPTGASTGSLTTRPSVARRTIA